jgi:succinoglycan biosynthesis protein ExoH
MDKNTSELIRALRLIMVMGLVLVHFGRFPGEALSPFSGVVDATYFYSASVNSFFTYFFLSAVPVLSMISGYLLCYQGKPDFSKTFRRKFTTLIFPALSWTSFWFLFAFILFLASDFSSKINFYQDVFNDLSIMDFFNGIIGITHSPLAIQFWFIHDLVLSILLAPLLYPLLKRFSVFPIIILIALWLMEWQPPGFFNLKVLSFFTVGLYFAIKGDHLTLPKANSWWNISIPAYVVLTFLRIYLPAFNNGTMPYETLVELLLRVTGSIGIIMLTLKLRIHLPKAYTWCINHSGYAFFLHAAHYPLVIYVKKALHMTGLFPGAGGQISLWALTFLLTIGIIIILAESINKFIPSMYRFLNGQRSI